MLDETPYIANPKDMRDLNQNMLLLIQKVNHEQSDMNKDIQATNKKVVAMEEDVGYLKTNFSSFSDTIKGMHLMLKILFGIITLVGTIISIGAAVSAFN